MEFLMGRERVPIGAKIDRENADFIDVEALRYE